MTAGNGTRGNPSGFKERFLQRRKLMSAREDAMRCAQAIRGMLAAGHLEPLRGFLREHYPADLAESLRFYRVERERALDRAGALRVLLTTA